MMICVLKIMFSVSFSFSKICIDTGVTVVFSFNMRTHFIFYFVGMLVVAYQWSAVYSTGP